MSLQTPDAVRTLQRKLYDKAKAEPGYRFYRLYDKVWRAGILGHADDRAPAQAGGPGGGGGAVRTDRSGRGGGLADPTGRGTACEDVSVPAGSTGDDPEGRRRGTA